MTDTTLKTPPVSEHHQTPEQELETNVLGMWIFLAGEMLFFAVLFTAYLVYRSAYVDTFAEASRHLDIVLGAANTAILLTSSFTMVLAVSAAQLRQRRLLVFLLLITIVLGTVFLGIKATEYIHKIQENLYPGGSFVYEGPKPGEARMFFSLYFIMTGIHALHMILGILALSILALFSWRGQYTAGRYYPVEMVGLYWHFVDIVWIFLFPLLYLIDRTV